MKLAVMHSVDGERYGSAVLVDSCDSKVKMWLNNHCNSEYYVLQRNSEDFNIPPHKLNTKKYVSALKNLGVTHVLASSAVGGLRPEQNIGDMVVIDQYIGLFQRHVTFFEEDNFALTDMTNPFCPCLRDILIKSCAKSGVDFYENGCYVGMDGPRYETAAEIRAMAHLNSDVVGMTIVPEAIMMREAGICYAAVCLIVNKGAGMEDEAIVNKKLLENRKKYNFYPQTVLKIAAEITLSQSGLLDGCNCCKTSSDIQ